MTQSFEQISKTIVTYERAQTLDIPSEKQFASGFFTLENGLRSLGYQLLLHPFSITRHNHSNGKDERTIVDFGILHPSKLPNFLIEVTETSAQKLLDSHDKQRQIRVMKSLHHDRNDFIPLLFPREILSHLEWSFSLLTQIANGHINWDEARRIIRKSIQHNDYSHTFKSR